MADPYLKALQNLTNGQSLALQAPSGTRQCPVGRIRIGIFYDGTGNNLYTDERNAGDILEHGNLSVNGPTNVVKLYRAYKPVAMPTRNKVYHHGPGTDYDAQGNVIVPSGPGATPASPVKRANKLGLGAGAGGKARIEWGLKQLAEFFSKDNRILAKEKYFDVFGFSRGAALCRDLVNQVKATGVDDLTRKVGFNYRAIIDSVMRYGTYERVDPSTITPKFMGIYDTVAQFFTGDTFLLDVDHTYVEYCVHHIAEDEFRFTFPVTSIFMDPNDQTSEEENKRKEYQNPRVYKKWMMEFWYPGAHSDIGGSYLTRKGTPAVPEKREQKVDWLGRTYTKVTPAVPEGPPLRGELQLIPLVDMNKAALKAQVPMNAINIEPPGDLKQAYGAYCAFRATKDYANHAERADSRYIHSYPDSQFRERFYKNTMYKDFLQPSNWRLWDGVRAWWNETERNAPREANSAFQYIRQNYIHDSAAEMEVLHHVDRPLGVRVTLQRTVLYAGAQPTKTARTHYLPKPAGS